MTTFTLNDGSEFEPSEEQIANMKRAYPAAEVEQQLVAIKLWCESHPSQRKTRRGAQAFMNAWFARVQNESGRFGKVPEIKQRVETSADEYRHQAGAIEAMRATIAGVGWMGASDYKINLLRLAREIHRRQTALLDVRWHTERGVQSACYGTMAVAVSDWFRNNA